MKSQGLCLLTKNVNLGRENSGPTTNDNQLGNDKIDNTQVILNDWSNCKVEGFETRAKKCVFIGYDSFEKA